MFKTSFEGAFSAGHDVIDPHLHDYRVRATCVGKPAVDGVTEGMVVDFRALDRAFHCGLKRVLEGTMIVKTAGQWTEVDDMPEYVIGFRPTVENLAHWCFVQIERHLPKGDARKLQEVTVWENDSCMATFSRC